MFAQQMEDDAGHAAGDDGDGGIGRFATVPMAAVESAEVSRAADGHPGGFDEGPAQPTIGRAQERAVPGVAAAGPRHRDQAGVGAEMIGVAKADNIVDLRGDQRALDGTEPGNALHPAGGGIGGVGRGDALLLGLDLRGEQFKQGEILAQERAVGFG